MKSRFFPVFVFLWVGFQPCFGFVHEWNGKIYDDETVAELITVITTTSPIPSIPSTRYLYEAQRSLHQIAGLAKCRKIIVFDAPKSRGKRLAKNYEEYKQNVVKLTAGDPYFAATELLFCSEWGCLSEAIRYAIRDC